MELSSHLPNLCLRLIYILLIQLEPIEQRKRERINYLFMCEEIVSEGLKEGSFLPPTSYNTRKKKKNKTKQREKKNSNCIS